LRTELTANRLGRGCGSVELETVS